MKTLGIFILIFFAIAYTLFMLEIKEVGKEEAKKKGEAVILISALLSLGITLTFFY